MITILKSKLHRFPVTRCDLNYEGSISIDKNLMREANITPYEKVQVVNINNGERLETYAIPSDIPNAIELNGAGARLAVPGDMVIIMSYSIVDNYVSPYYQPTVILNEQGK